ncbi:hypothetical protein [Pseudomonas sp. zfem003]|uniref:hypothetical protein n=1 Tax=Pseudomonas sp. zfem003 TaxID=3078198 RepID=UPI0029283311|nr:hypothetical protein [Pseudomonas sp. zfem003]MDU9399022.1 hypothetical protein [Pseudomonas sp. zfem003]
MNSQRNHQVEEFAAETLTDALTLAARRGYGQTAPIFTQVCGTLAVVRFARKGA